MSIVGNKNRYARIRREREKKRDQAVMELMIYKNAKFVTQFPSYLVTANGEVFSSCNRRVKKLRPGTKPAGYRFVGLHRDGKTSYKHVHRLVAEAFIPNPLGLLEVNHKNGLKTDNRVENLEWVTRSENAQHAMDSGLNKQRGTTARSAKLNADQVRLIHHAKGKYRDLGATFGVCAQTVCKIKAFRSYKDVPR